MHRTLAISTRTDSVVPYTTLFRSVVDPPTVVATHLNQLIAMNASEMFGLDEARKLLDNLKDAAPQLVDGLTPGLLSLTQISALCRALLSEGIALKDFRRICEAMVDAARPDMSHEQLVEAVRQRIGALIIQGLEI